MVSQALRLSEVLDIIIPHHLPWPTSLIHLLGLRPDIYSPRASLGGQSGSESPPPPPPAPSHR